ncbi:2-oxoglutarate dehydrogenase E1 subunit family protein, partial [Agromyces seonyuensis]|nr:hypothetical protein [Agromyces seonyuensis]
MSSQLTGSGPEETTFGANEWLVDEMYEKFLADPQSVDETWRAMLAQYRPDNAPAAAPAATTPAPPAQAPTSNGPAGSPEAPAATAPAAAVSAPAPVLKRALVWGGILAAVILVVGGLVGFLVAGVPG